MTIIKSWPEDEISFNILMLVPNVFPLIAEKSHWKHWTLFFHIGKIYLIITR